MTAYRLPIDIINAGLLQLGVERIRAVNEQSVNAIEGNAAYNRLREVELRANNWTFAIRRTILRPVDENTLLYTPAAYAAGTVYAHGAIVTYDNQWWQSQVGSNLANTPDPGPYWQHYYGPDSLKVYDPDTTYFAGEIVLGSDNGIYLSLLNAVTTDPVAVGTNWLALTGTTAVLSILYPVGAGPSTQNSTRNAYRLPRGFLRRAPHDPKAGINSWLGAPSGAWADDWAVEGGYIITGEVTPIMLRYVADVTNVAQMDPMFCEALGALIAVRIGPRVVEAGKSRIQLLDAAEAAYRGMVFRARTENGIEAGPVEPPEDDYLTVRW